MPRNARWIYDGMDLFRIVALRHTYRDWRKVVAKTIVKLAHQK